EEEIDVFILSATDMSLFSSRANKRGKKSLRRLSPIQRSFQKLVPVPFKGTPSMSTQTIRSLAAKSDCALQRRRNHEDGLGH
ncbi:hypothetical protein Tco_0547223, partial [Tanacetum coccineum]